MKLNPEDLAKITDFTLSHYNEHAEDFWEGKRDHNVNQNITALLQSIEGEPPYTILDFGCGPGRDLKVFAELGHIAVGLDGAPHFAVMARAMVFYLGESGAGPIRPLRPAISAPPGILQSTHEATLDVVDLADLKHRALEQSHLQALEIALPVQLEQLLAEILE
jgi:SAM-dependent methyltransferase